MSNDVKFIFAKKGTSLHVRSTFEVELRKICTTLWRESVRKSKSLKLNLAGSEHFLKLANLRHAVWHESDLEVKIVKNWHARSAF